jgi:CHAD domain-containing protein
LASASAISSRLGNSQSPYTKQCGDAPSEYKALAAKVRSLQNILLNVEDLLQSDKLSLEKKMELLEHGQSCDGVLKELQAMMTK